MRLVYLCVAIICLSACTDDRPSKGSSGSSSFNWWAWTPGDSVDDSSQSLFTPGYRPDQPIKFDHSLHAGELKIDCEYCHNSARRSPAAGLPSLGTCMGCHKVAATGRPEIQKITGMYQAGQSIEWERVHDLPDFVRFSHDPHINVRDEQGNPLFTCETCHGNVKGMTVVEQWAPLQMGWCLECHNQTRVPAHDGKPAVTNASVSCNTCHY